MVFLVVLLGLLALVPVTSASAAPSAVKTCTLSATNQYTCTFTITPGVAIGPGDLLVQMVPGGPGTFTSLPTAVSATGCSNAPTISPGQLISIPSGTADYDVTIGPGGCLSTAVVTVTETVSVTSSGQVCQKVWVTAAAPAVTSCATVVFTPLSTASAAKACTLTTTPNVYTCLFTVTPGFPAAAGNPGDILHIGGPFGPLMTGPGTFVSTPTVAAVIGCAEAPPVVTLLSPTSYQAAMIGAGCPGTTWSVQFIETIAVTASGQICQPFYMVAAVPPVTACATVVFTPPTAGPSAVKACTLSTTPNVYNCTFTITPGVATAAGVAWLVQMVSPGPGSFTAPTPTVSSSTTGCGSGSSLPTVTAGTLINSQLGIASYDVTIGSAGCTAQAVVVINETVVVTATGQICQTVWINVLSPGITSCAPCVFTCPCGTPVSPVAQTVTATSTGVYCFVYSGPTTPVASFVTRFTAGVSGVNKMNLPDSSYSSWFSAAPQFATIVVLSNGDLICVAAPPGTAVFT